MPNNPGRDGSTAAGPVRFLCLLLVAGIAMRMTLLAVPPVIPLVHAELGMTETQIGLLIGLPLAVFAVAAVPGSLLIARIGADSAVILGMVVAALAGGARGAATDVWSLYAAVIASGFGMAIMQPGMPTLVHQWLPSRIALGTIAYSTGMIVGAMLPPILTFPLVLPLVGASWRLDLVVWAVPAMLMAVVFFLFCPKDGKRHSDTTAIVSGGRWWPDWRNPLIWILGLTFGSNNSPFFGANAFLGDYLASEGQAKVLGPALTSLNGAQIIALAVLFLLSGRLQRRAWPFLIFGPGMVVGFLGLILFQSPAAIVVSSGLIGIATALTMTALLALPPLLSAPGDVPRTAAGMFTVSYTCAIVIPTVCGALWDTTGKPWTVFAPLCLCGVVLTLLGAIAARFPSASEKALGATGRMRP